MQYTYFVFIYYLLTSTFIFYYQFVIVEKLINNKEELTIVLFLKLNWMQVVSLGLGLPFSFRKDEKNKMTRLGDVQDTNHTVIHTYMYTPHIRLFCANRRHCGKISLHIWADFFPTLDQIRVSVTECRVIHDWLMNIQPHRRTVILFYYFFCGQIFLSNSW